MTDLTNCEMEPLRQDGEFALARVSRPNGLPSRLLLSPVMEQPAPSSLAKLENAFALRDELDASWAARPVELVKFRGRPALVIEDPDGELLDQKGVAPLAAPDFLRLAIGIASSLASLHGKGLVHKDVKPANLIANARTGEAWLTGFSLATRLPRHRQAPETPEIIAGTLAYMAPEQTGRMNRSIDSRSDLYSLGVSFYELLVGALPFTASDPMEWVHCHVARLPVAPSLRRSQIPEPLSAIILKLLAKAPEERYQTAAGVEADLRRCLSAWEARGRIEPFSLGAGDVPDRLVVPEKLYGREREIELLLAAFDRVISQGATGLVLVSGYSGVGKSSVVNELHKALVPPRGLFAAGKFDQYKRDIPYATLAQAFQRLIRSILAKTEAELGRWRESLLQALEPHGALIVDLVPELKLIIGEQEPVPELPAADTQRRFQLLLRRFIGVFGRPEHPLVLFLDDLQWLDAATLELLEDLLAQKSVSHLLLIGAYRSNEVDASHPLTRKLVAIKAAGASSVDEITLGPLDAQHVSQLIADALHCETDRVRDLAQLILQKTDGNPFFINQFLSTLTDEGLIAFDSMHSRWSWDLRRIYAQGYTDNVADLMIAKLVRLPAATQLALQQLACLGHIATLAMLAIVHNTTEQELHASLLEARRQELVDFLESSYRFVHDRVHEAAYALIPTERRAAVHLRIGRMLVADTPPGKLDETIFEVVNQLNRGAALISSRDERVQLAELNLLAGQRAKQSTAYNSALTYLAAGRALLPEDRWERCDALSFALELCRAECEFLTGELAAAEERLAMLASRAARLVDFAAVTNLREELFTTLGRSDRAIEACFDYLRRVGVEWPKRPLKEEVRQEYERLRRQIGHRSIEELVKLPPMTDPEWRATMDVLTAVVSPALFTDENLLCLVICRMANLSLEHGNSDGSCFAYVWLGMLLGPHFGDYRAGFRFGKLGLDLVEQRGLRRFEARVYLIFGHRVIPWTQPIRTGRSLVRRAFDAANKLGDLTFAAYSCDNLITNLLASGDPLVDVQAAAEAGLDFARRARFGLVIDRITTQLRLIRTLRGLTPELGSFNDAEFDEGRFEQHLKEEPQLAIAACWYWIRKLQARFFAGAYASAIAAAANAEQLLWTSPSFFELAEYHLYSALTRAALFDSIGAAERAPQLEALALHHRQLQEWAENCPENFANRAALVGAEAARIEGRDVDAMHLYEQAIRSAREHGFVQNEGVAHEVAARFYAARGFETFADAYLRNARYCYLRWGADGKVQQLDRLYPHLAASEGPRPPSLNATIGAPVGQLDAETVARASQALSSEIVLPKLIERLMRIAVEHAGAERGLLVLLRGSEPLIEAEASTGLGRVEVQVRQTDLAPSDLPMSALQYVIRTRERVVLDDASVTNSYSDDGYWEQRKAKSVLCLPIVKQTMLIGVLYLENNLTPHVFNSGRVAVLEMLASQAAISLENAGLYAALEQENLDRKQAEEALRSSERELNQTVNTIPTTVWSTLPDGACDFLNQRWLEYTGLTEAQALGWGWEVAIHPDDLGPLLEYWKSCLASGTPIDTEIRMRRHDGVYRWFLLRGDPLRDESGKILKWLGTNTDIDDRKQAEQELRRNEATLRELQDELAHIARVATMGELAASIAHEINQPIAGVVINGNACLRWLSHVQDDSPHLKEAREAVQRIIRDGDRAGEVIARIRTLFKKTGSAKEPMDFNETLREIIVLAKSEMDKQRVALRLELAADLPSVLGDRVQLQQVMLNLILNAIDAMAMVQERPRELVIRTQSRGVEEVMVTVRDTGIGLHPESFDRVFKAFHTTKPGGLGMGLSISRSIIESHAGRLWVAVHDGPGASFCFTLPRQPSQSRPDRGLMNGPNRTPAL